MSIFIAKLPYMRFAGVCLLRCKRGIGEMLAALKECLDKSRLFCHQRL